MNYIQQTSFSNSDMGRDLISLLSAYGHSHVRKAFETVKNRAILEARFREFLNADFVGLENNPNSKTDIPYQSVDRALAELMNFTKQSTLYGSEENKKRKAGILLDSVTFQESECLFRIMTGNYDRESFRVYLFPQTSKKKREVEEKEAE